MSRKSEALLRAPVTQPAPSLSYLCPRQERVPGQWVWEGPTVGGEEVSAQGADCSVWVHGGQAGAGRWGECDKERASHRKAENGEPGGGEQRNPRVTPGVVRPGLQALPSRASVFPRTNQSTRGSHSLQAWPLPGPMNSKNMMDPEFK